MRKYFTAESLTIGLALFSMFFGAGNIIYPLAVGNYAGDQNLYAMLGLILTAAIMPLAGVIALILYNGNTGEFFGRLGRFPGMALAFIIISLLGPLGSTPRCIALSYTTLKGSFLEMSPVLFSAISCVLIFLFAVKKNHLLTLLGWVLTPFLLTALIIIIAVGIMLPAEAHSVDYSTLSMFLHGLKEGYNTMDLLAAFFFSATILNILRLRVGDNDPDKKRMLGTAFCASIIGAILLAAIYVGFSSLSALHSQGLAINGKDELLSALTMKIAGPYAGILVCVTIVLACLTTAIALISAFTDFVQKELFKERVSYEMVLTVALAITFVVSTFEFSGISAFLEPVLQICYPGLIVLTFLNIAHRLIGFNTVRVPVFATFTFSAISQII